MKLYSAYLFVVQRPDGLKTFELFKNMVLFQLQSSSRYDETLSWMLGVTAS
jgi:hypothetical protein